MFRIAQVLLLAPLTAALAGCAALEPIAPFGGELSLDFDVTPAIHGQWLETPQVNVTPAGREIVVQVRMSTPDPCRAIEADAYEDDGGIVLAVRVRPEGGMCVAVMGTFDYTATLSGLDRGAHRLTITHLIEDTGDPGPHTVFDGEVVLR